MASQKPIALKSGTLQEIGAGDVLNIPAIAGDPVSPANGDIWYDTTGNKFRKRENGVSSDMDTGGGTGLTDAQVLARSSIRI